MTTFKSGIHHISVIAGNPQQNADFYTQVLGMRLVKKSVNQDAPDTYHLFYANKAGSPGSDLTFFPWPNARQGKAGVGEAVTVSLAVPKASKMFWAEYLSEHGIDFNGPYNRFGQEAISFKDPDLLQLELVFDDESESYPAWDGGPVAPEHGIRGFRGTTLRLRETTSTATILKEIFQFRETDQKGNQIHFTTDAQIGGSVILQEHQAMPSSNGKGIVHHVAFRAEDMDDLARKRGQVLSMGIQPTDLIDRHWFHSVYFRTPGGVLFEIATDGPGFAVDEDAEKLGQKLILPPWLESQRNAIEKALPPVTI